MDGQHLWAGRRDVSGQAAGAGTAQTQPETILSGEALDARTGLFPGHDFSNIPLHAESEGGPNGVLPSRAAVTQEPLTSPSPVVRDVLQGAGEQVGGGLPSATLGGSPLDAKVRASMEAGFGRDFSAVRVHAEERASAAARALHARAFTMGTHVIFARDAYQPATRDGLRLIAHELAHVVQQGGRLPMGRVPHHAGEEAADEAARVIAEGGRARVSELAVTGPQLSPDGPGGGATRSPALTPEEMWALVHGRRGFESSSGGPGDTHRSAPATVPPGSLRVNDAGDPVGKGAPLGKGYETFASVQLVDADGNRVAIAVDSNRGAGPENHAEAHCVRSLEAHGPKVLPGGKLVVVGDQVVCSSCREGLVKYAQSRGLTVIEPHEPVRAKMVGTGDATAKTTSRSATQAGRPQLVVVARTHIPVPPPEVPTPDGAPPTPQAKSPAPRQTRRHHKKASRRR